MDVSLGELRSINVNFVGQVKYPGVYPCSSIFYSNYRPHPSRRCGYNWVVKRAIQIKREWLNWRYSS